MVYVQYSSHDDQGPHRRREAEKRRKREARRARWALRRRAMRAGLLRRLGAAARGGTSVRLLRLSSRLRRGTAAHLRYQATRARTDLDQAIELLSEAARVRRATQRRRAAAANNLAVALLDRSRLRSSQADLDEAIRVLDAAARLRLGDGPAEVRRLTNLIDALETRTAAGGVDWSPRLNELRHRLGSLRSAPADVRIEVLRACGYARAAAEGPTAGHDDLAAAIALLPRAASWDPFAGAPAQVLSDNTGLAADAAACALAAGRPVRAIELFETGRALQWDHLLHRAIRAELQVVRPRLARKLDRAVAGLNRRGGLPADPRLAVLHRWAVVDRLADARLRRGYARSQRRWNRQAPRAQAALPDATLGMQQYVQDILPAAAEGPVVAVVVSRFGCYALIVRPDLDEPQVIELGELSYSSAQDRARRYLTALNEAMGPAREQEIFATLHWLWSVLVAPVLAALDRPDGADGPPRLWWCPSGALAALPLHAACAADPADPADPGDDGERAGAMLDRGISSYAPTLRSLISARKARDMRQQTLDQSEQHDERRLLLVSVDQGGNRANLPAAARFRGRLPELIAADRLTRLEGTAATGESVTRALGRHVWAHFDCHGVQDLDRPFESGLALHDKTLTVAELAVIRARRPEYAFLAACTTALAHARMPDEMISLASALHYSGYQHVIGTLSPVLDSSTGRVSHSLYDALTSGGRIWPEESANSLRQAVLAERARSPRHPSTWVPYVHVGV